MHTLFRVKQTAGGKLPCPAGSPAWRSVKSVRGGFLGGEGGSRRRGNMYSYG